MGEKRGMKALELWCKRVTDGYPGVKVENMTTSWRDGLAFCALIHHFRPDLIDFANLKKNNIYVNNELAFRIAERHLGIPALLDAEDMVEYEVPDRLSILTYLSQFYQTFASHPSSPVKRSPDSPDCSLISSASVSSPPPKEGRRREPCVVCGLPVFLAQRLLVSGRLYHRTCFRCARCSSQLTLANCYETQGGVYCCETCPDEETMPQPPDIGDKGGGYADDATLYIQPTPAHKTDPDPLATSRSASLVGLRRMMFENISVANTKTDDEKLPLHKLTDLDLVECDKSDFSDKPKLSDRSVALDVKNKCSVRLSDSRSDEKSDGSVVKSVKSDSVVDESVLGKIDLSSDDLRPKIVVTQCSLDNTNEGGKLDSTKELSTVDKPAEELPSSNKTTEEFSSLDVSDKNIIATENKILIDSQINLDVDSDLEPDCSSSEMPIVQAKNNLINKPDSYKNTVETGNKILIDSQSNLDVDSDLEPDSSSSEMPIVQAKNNLINKPDSYKNTVETGNKILIDSQSNLDVDSDLEPDSSSSEMPIVQAKNNLTNKPDDEIEYRALTDSKESLESRVIEAKNNEFDNPDFKDCKSLHSETEGLLSHAESGSLKEPEEETEKNEDEFSSLTHNIEQLVIEANNDIVNRERSSMEESFERKDETEKDNVTLPKVPTPTKRVVKHKPPVPQSRKGHEDSEQKDDSTKAADEYPEELNPFGDEEEEVDRAEKLEEKRKLSAASLNPFGSSDEEEEDLKTPVRKSEGVPKPATRKVIPAPKVNLNPFWSGDEEEEDTEDSLPPVPKPRKNQPSPEPSPGPQRLRSATGSIGSATSLLSRKKNRAPLPPNWPGAGTISRKSYLAPKPPAPRTVTPSPPPLPTSSPPSSLYAHDKDDKDFINHQRRSSIVSETSSIGTISSYMPHKSMYGQWKRKKGPAPARPVPIRRAVQPMPLSSVRQELDDIEIKQQGLERQGVKLEQTIRDKFEQEGASLTPYVEEMVLQLFELVNEKNELFRRQAELMYLRRQHSLEEEHAELEYQIRCLMLCPEANKTDSDKAKEEQLIQRLVEVVERRNEIIDCLEMDRLREKEEDRSVGAQLGIFSAAVGSEVDLRAKPDTKPKKTEKKKRWSRKDSEREVTEERDTGEKKKKKKWFTLHHSSKS